MTEPTPPQTPEEEKVPDKNAGWDNHLKWHVHDDIYHLRGKTIFGRIAVLLLQIVRNTNEMRYYATMKEKRRLESMKAPADPYLPKKKRR